VSTAQFFIGVDGAATSWRVRMRSVSAGELTRDAGSAANICVDLDAGCGVSCEFVVSVIAKAALGAERFAFVGGVAESLRTYVPAGVATALRRPRHDAVGGAILFVGEAQAAPGENS
jgi:N-acetylglucosamine kinase-like BadF-type ATPase